MGMFRVVSGSLTRLTDRDADNVDPPGARPRPCRRTGFQAAWSPREIVCRIIGQGISNRVELPVMSSCSTSISERAVRQRGHQLIRRSPRYSNPSSNRRTNTSRTASDSPSSMVKRNRSQSHDAPSRFNCSMIVSPDFAFHSQTRSRNRSRPSASRECLRLELPFDHVLSRNTGMVHAGHPQHIVALHAAPSDQIS